MRIAICSTFPPYRGGIAQFNARLSEELAKEHTVHRITWTRQYPKLLFPGTDQFDPSFLVDDGAAERVLDSIDPFSWERTAKRIISGSPDLLFVRYWTPFLAPATASVARKVHNGGVKVVGIVDNLLPHERHVYDKPLARRFLRACDRIVTLSGSVAAEVRMLDPRIPVSVLSHPLYDHFGPPSSPNEAYRALGLRSGPRDILFFGLIRPYKGLEVLLQAFERLPGDTRLIIAGEPYGGRDALRRRIDAHPCRERLVLHDHFVRDDLVRHYFSIAQVVALPYLSATQSGVTAAAFHFDVPVVSSDVGGLREVVLEGRTGALVPPRDPESLARALEHVLAKGKGSYRPGIEALKEKLSWTRFAAQLTTPG
ncbi:MAG: glycosyltransferase [Flavobacteriales bacterium]|nr:glycosyltransferase [Flavobacteriales bacterium]